MFYEQKHSLESNYFNVEENEDFSFPIHIHPCFEIIVVTKGEMLIRVEENERILHENEATIIFPNQVHGLRTESSSSHKLCVFSKSLVNYYSKKTQNTIPEDPFFTLDSVTKSAFESLSNDCNLAVVKGVLYLLCGLFDRDAVYLDSKSRNSNLLIYRMLDYIEMNYKDECTLKQLTEEFKYDYVYLSKFFMRNAKMTFNEYVNRRRVSEVCHLLSTTELTVLEICVSSGFGSLRSLNRNFKDIMGVTPAVYRMQMKNKVDEPEINSIEEI